ncbi:hypothetical protein ATERTT37_003469 [Aspergillus terreus]
MVEMRVLLQAVYSRFRTTVASDMTGCMDIDDQIISSRPKDQTCRLDFARRDRIADELFMLLFFEIVPPTQASTLRPVEIWIKILVRSPAHSQYPMQIPLELQ